MHASDEIRFDAASRLLQGKRDLQEDALATEFPTGSEFGFAVLSDGMGGHEAGDIASRIIVDEVFSKLKKQSAGAPGNFTDITGILSDAAHSANERLAEHSRVNPSTAGMGATLITLVMIKKNLFWISIGDSPLFLFRDNQLTQLNDDHSLAPQIDYMVESGMLSETAGRNHPDRSCLTSALIGEEIPQIDCPSEPFNLRSGDLVIAASDGLQFLSNSQIEQILQAKNKASSSDIAELLLAEIADLNDPYQDNVAFTIIEVQDHSCPKPYYRDKIDDCVIRSTTDAAQIATYHHSKLNPGALLFSFFARLRYSVRSWR